MTGTARIAAALVLAASLAGCSLSSLVGGGSKAPPALFTLTSEAAPATPTRSAAVGETVTIRTPLIPEALRTDRVPVQLNATQVQYVKDLQWVDTPDRLFQQLVEETVRRTTGRVVLDPEQSALDPGLVVTGELNRFGYDAQQRMAVVQYDASLATQGGSHVETRRFEASVPADGTAGTVSLALNQAANQVARDVAAWIGG
ncbi:MAG TPA: ABC-type transport auxiliary lipoprotein family protein [Sphingomicrobium sp.]|nr:ABC-type transport auxiliary lipoprotein family protein [Sphingomicrobium sp.]